MIRRALVWAQNHGEPLPRALARDYFQAAGEAQLAAIERTQAAADLNQARRARHDAQYYRDQCEAGLKGKEKLAWRLGCPPKSLRMLLDAVRDSQAAVGQAKQKVRSAIAAGQAAAAKAERHSKRLLERYLNAHPGETHHFTEQGQSPPMPERLLSELGHRPPPGRPRRP